jgi:hypothetical protein
VHWSPELQDLLEKTLPKGWTSDVVAPPAAAAATNLLEHKWIQPAADCTRVSSPVSCSSAILPVYLQLRRAAWNHGLYFILACWHTN